MPDRNAGKPPTTRGTGPRRPASVPPGRPSLVGGTPAQDRELRAQGRQTVQKLLEAGLAEFDERGFQAVRVDDVVRRANISHGTFYLYFSNKDDLFKALLSDALIDIGALSDSFPVVTRDEAGQQALRSWVSSFCDAYAAHASVIRILSQAEIVGEEVWGDGLQLMFRLSEAIAGGMTTAAGTDGRETPPGHAELTALALLMMLERINYLLTVEVRLPRDEMIDRLTAIVFASFHSS